MSWKDDKIVPTPLTQGGQEPWRADELAVQMPERTSGMLDYLNENASTPGGLAGTIVGGTLGLAVGRPFMGAMAGGAIGTGGGSVASDVMSDRDINISKAITEAGISVGIDLTTAGFGKYIGKPLFEYAKKLIAKGEPVESVARELAKRAEEAKNAGMSKEGIESQEILAKKGLSLTPFQAGVGGKWDIAKELIARTGIVSKSVFDGKSKQIRDLVRERMSLVVSNENKLSNDLIGQGINQSWQAGKKALDTSYGTSLDEIGKLVAGGKFKTSVLSNSLENFVKKNSDVLGDSTLTKETGNIIGDLTSRLKDTDVASGIYLIQFEKRLGGLINEASKDSTKAVTELELSNLRKEVQGVIAQQMDNMGKMSQKAVDAGKQYRVLQSEYSGAVNSLFPTVNEGFVKQAKKGVYTSLGAMFANKGKVQNVEASLKSIDQAYKLIAPDVAKSMQFKTAREAKDAIAQGYLTKTFPDLTEEGFKSGKFLSGFKTAEKQLQDPTETKRLKAILGGNFETYKRTVNLMNNASKQPASGLSVLFLRSKEYAAGAGLATGVVTGVVDASTAGVSALAILGTPYFLAKAATNPKTLNKLIKINKAKPNNALILGTTLANDVIDEAMAEGMDDENMIQLLKGYKKSGILD